MTTQNFLKGPVLDLIYRKARLYRIGKTGHRT